MMDKRQSVRLWMGTARRAISPVIGVTMMLLVVFLLFSATAGMLLTFGDRLAEPDFTTDDNSSSLNPWNDGDALLAPEDPVAGAENIRYRILFEIQSSDSDIEGDSLNEIQVSVSGVDENMFSGVDKSGIEKFEVEKTDGTVLDIKDDVESEDNWAFQDGGSTLEMTLSGSGYTNPQVGDKISVVFGDVDNPTSPGTYDIGVTLNQGLGDESGTIEIVEGEIFGQTGQVVLADKSPNRCSPGRGSGELSRPFCPSVSQSS